MAVQTFRDSIAWQKAMDLTTAIYAATRLFPREEMFGLTNQLRRASISTASNIAEGQGRLTTGEFIQFLGIARGSALEVETQLEISRRLELGDPGELDAVRVRASELVRILNSVITSLRAKQQAGRPQAGGL